MVKFGVVSVAVVAAAVLSACQGDSGGKAAGAGPALDVVHESAAKLEQAATFRLTLETGVTGGRAVSSEGVVDLARHREQLSAQVTGRSTENGRTSERVMTQRIIRIDDIVYADYGSDMGTSDAFLCGPSSAPTKPATAKFMRMDLAEAGPEAEAQRFVLPSAIRLMLAIVRSAESARPVAGVKVDGQDAAGYEISVTAAGLAKHVPAGLAKEMQKQDSKKSMKLKVWIRADGQPVRIEVIGADQPAGVPSRIEIHDHGKPVAIEAPPAAEVQPSRTSCYTPNGDWREARAASAAGSTWKIFRAPATNGGTCLALELTPAVEVAGLQSGEPAQPKHRGRQPFCSTFPQVNSLDALARDASPRDGLHFIFGTVDPNAETVMVTFNDGSRISAVSEQGTWIVVWRGTRQVKRAEFTADNASSYCDFTTSGGKTRSSGCGTGGSMGANVGGGGVVRVPAIRN